MCCTCVCMCERTIRQTQSFVDHFCYLCLVFVMLLRLFIVALWSPAGKGLTSLFLFVKFNCVFVTFPCNILGKVWYLIVSIPDRCHLSYYGNTMDWYLQSTHKQQHLFHILTITVTLYERKYACFAYIRHMGVLRSIIRFFIE